MAFLSPSPIELVVILVIALMVLGPSRLPDTARSIGRGMRELRDSFQGLGDDDEDDDAPGPRDDPGGLPVELPEGVEHGDYDDDLEDDLDADDDELGADADPYQNDAESSTPSASS